ncbi:hypothetical protein F5Y13DRAFT_89666 [Hypoxylon sp. FL1857]|nr:hypothetical protein F5Y13DRAFT_89666 [Hypoxylon sp. FL1857]
MKSDLLFLSWFRFIMTSIPAANGPSEFERQPGLGNQFYTVFAKAGVDTSKIDGFIKSTVGADNLRPWTDAQKNLVSWTVEASEEESSRLQEHVSIDRVTKLEISPQPGNLACQDSVPAEDDNWNSLVFPVDGSDLQQCNQTDASLWSFLRDKIRRPLIYKGEVSFWVATLNDTQVKQVKGITGVHAVEPNGVVSNGLIWHDKRPT